MNRRSSAPWWSSVAGARESGQLRELRVRLVLLAVAGVDHDHAALDGAAVGVRARRGAGRALRVDRGADRRGEAGALQPRPGVADRVALHVRDVPLVAQGDLAAPRPFEL